MASRHSAQRGTQAEEPPLASRQEFQEGAAAGGEEEAASVPVQLDEARVARLEVHVESLTQEAQEAMAASRVASRRLEEATTSARRELDEARHALSACIATTVTIVTGHCRGPLS